MLYIPQYDLICNPNQSFSTIANLFNINVYLHFDPTAQLNRNFSQEVTHPFFCLLRLVKLRSQFCIFQPIWTMYGIGFVFSLLLKVVPTIPVRPFIGNPKFCNIPLCYEEGAI